MWGWFIVLFAAVWLLQIWMAKAQLKNYHGTIRELSRRPSGYLGVGIQKQKLGIGAVAIVVIDDTGTVVESRLMRGVTVFSRFEPFPEYIGLPLDALKASLGEEPEDRAFRMAIDKIEFQMTENTNLAV
ncbi:transcriptional regulator GutM [Microbacterium sp. APC 3898]|uniref:Transcriptional regulator GutM n=1 Tax=Planococcus notacanthi TaxID=3035188 RepID=A0ABT7ZJK7_9BACL|nr:MULTISPECIES: transcriptional regulator GutM [Terrabacteria group]MBF6632566.1 transcriptional regulator GutM [Planococcus sp. (in: firmicutes)]MDN3427334.1 transcriptional regulator GutM [Planococcus sp. APC 4016]MDN3499616.1 transcriptional regulator GutM [Microbacterium sp. APC 3898]